MSSVFARAVQHLVSHITCNPISPSDRAPARPPMEPLAAEEKDPPVASGGHLPCTPINRTTSVRDGSGAASSPPSWLEIRLFYVRISPCSPDSVPPHLTLSHVRREASVDLDFKGSRVQGSDPSSLSLRRDRLDREAAEVTYVSTDAVRLTGFTDLEVSDDRGNIILCGSIERMEANGAVQHQAPSSSDKDPKTGWSMDCSAAAPICHSSFVQPKLGILSPSFEVYVAGCCAGSPLILTQTVHHSPPQKSARTGNLDSVPDDDDDDASGREERDDEGSKRRKAPPTPSMDGGDENMDLAQIQRAGLSVIVACTTLMLELLRRREVLPREPSMYRDMRRKAKFQRIIDGGRDSCTDFIRMDRPAFFRLVEIMRQRSLLRDTIHVSIEEQLAMFLHIVGHNCSNRVMKTDFIRSGETISRYFNLVLGAICSIRDEFVRQPGSEAHTEITNNPLYYPWFKDCIGVVGATHIEATVPADVAGRFRGKKDRPTQNVLAAVTPDKRFCYVLAGWEGSATDSTILTDALSMPPPDGLRVIEGKYYLVDAEFATMPGFITPYQSVSYHPKEQAGCIPQNSQELFNLRHSSLCSKVKSAFGTLKNRFKILCSHPSFPFPTQVDIVLACCVIHNYILGIDPHDKFLNEENEVFEDEEEDDFWLFSEAWILPEQIEETRQWVALRDKIAEDMWLDYNKT